MGMQRCDFCGLCFQFLSSMNSIPQCQHKEDLRFKLFTSSILVRPPQDHAIRTVVQRRNGAQNRIFAFRFHEKRFAVYATRVGAKSGSCSARNYLGILHLVTNKAKGEGCQNDWKVCHSDGRNQWSGQGCN